MTPQKLDQVKSFFVFKYVIPKMHIGPNPNSFCLDLMGSDTYSDSYWTRGLYIFDHVQI